MLIDTHCHIHDASYPLDTDTVLASARLAGVEKMICVGTSQQSSQDALDFAANKSGVYAALGVHPHDTKDGWSAISQMLAQAPNEQDIVAIGEIGLDYFYTHSPRDQQITALEEQLSLAVRYDLPVIFHVREAFEDFWPIFDNFPGIKGVLHSFTDSQANLEQALKRSLFIGVNGISTFTKDPAQQQLFATIPLEYLLLETDAPFLTPKPFRGKINEPAFVKNVAEHHANIRGLSVDQIAEVTSANAQALFALT